nr:phosphosulfolactate synthase [Rubrobacter aplysinae]
MNEREEKLRQHGLTEIRGPYYSVVGKRYLSDVLETMGPYVDSLKFAGGAFTLMPEDALKEITESVQNWRTDVPAEVINSLGLKKVMFEAADPEVFEWYVKNYGPEVSLFVDHSRIIELEAPRRGIRAPRACGAGCSPTSARKMIEKTANNQVSTGRIHEEDRGSGGGRILLVGGEGRTKTGGRPIRVEEGA